jgi:Sigma-70, region 4
MMRRVDQTGHSFRLVPPRRAAGKRERDMFVLRALDGWTYQEIGHKFGVSPERVRQLLSVYCGLSGTPPAAAARRRPPRRG